MLPQINGKSFLECTKEDLIVLIDNPDFRENEYIDYKRNFSFLEMSKGKERDEKIAEFRSDVCSFANAGGGYLIFGISDVDGCASELVGIEINNTDRFELDRRNNLTNIQPRMPYLKFHFIKLDNGKYILVIYVKSDGFKPYTHIINESSYPMYKRSGNKKQIMTYTEMKNMFNQSLTLDKEIYNYRMERIEHYKKQSETKDDAYSQFMMLHIIPETFLDSSYNQNMFAVEKINGIRFSPIFSSWYCNSTSIPCVDGLKYIANNQKISVAECSIKNNAVIECFLSLALEISPHKSDKFPNGYLPWKYIWEKIESVCSNSFDIYQKICPDTLFYVAISFVGCKDVITERREEFLYLGKIDRNNVICSPIAINDLSNDDERSLFEKKLYIEYLLSIGRKNDEVLSQYIQDVYNI